MSITRMSSPIKLSAARGYTFVQVLVAILSLVLMVWIASVLHRITHWHYGINFGIVLLLVFLLLRGLDRRSSAGQDTQLDQTLHHAPNMAVTIEGILKQISSLPEVPPTLELFVPDNLTLAGVAVSADEAVDRICGRLAGKRLVLQQTDRKGDGRLCHFVHQIEET